MTGIPHQAGTSNVSRRAVLGGMGGLSVFAVLPGWASAAQADTPSPSAYTVALNSTWKFAKDPTDIGASTTYHWYADTFDDSGWQNLLSGKSWESQGVAYAGYAWYRQQFTVPAEAAGNDLTLVLASLGADDDVYLNGVRYAGIKGQYKYADRMLRTYTIPAAKVRFGQSNTLAIRIWGGNLEFIGANSGLIAGKYQAQFNPYRLMARKTGSNTEQALELYDLSSAQVGKAFDLVIRMDPAKVTGSNLSYALKNYAATMLSGHSSITTGADGIARVVVPIDAATSRKIYLAGRFTVETEMTQVAGASDWVDTGKQMTVMESVDFSDVYRLYTSTFPAGVVTLPTDGDGVTRHGMYTVAVTGSAGLTITNLTVNDTANAADWSVQSNMQVGNQAYGDRAYTISSLPPELVGAAWIRTAVDSKTSTAAPLATFTVNQPVTVYIGVETRSLRVPWVRSTPAENLNFAGRDTTALPALSATYENTPYGSLKLVDVIDCSTSLDVEAHPYLQSSYTESAQKGDTPGSALTTTVSTILGKPARESSFGWFAYRIGRGSLTVGASYLLRIEYAEDKPRYGAIEIQAGQNYMDVGWRNGVSSSDVYDPWPISGSWQTFDVIFPLGKETLGAGGVGDGNAQKGVWVYIMNQVKPGYQFSMYQGGPAIATIKLYEISPTANAPAITKPAGLPQRVLTVDWERQPTQVPADIVNYAKLMGYSAISPLTLKWAFANYGDPVAGYDAVNVDAAHYWVTGKYVQGSGAAPAPAVPGVASVHNRYLAATKNSGVDYLPRFEWGGSYDLPLDAQAIGADGNPAPPSRFGSAGHWVANILDSRNFDDLKGFLDSLLKPYAAANPQLKGALWRIREDRVQPSYGPADITKFCTDTGTTKPSGYTDAQLAAWASTGAVGDAYAEWWQGKRAAFHQQIVDLIKSYRPDLALYLFLWDAADKFSIMLPDRNQGAFYAKLNNRGGPAVYAEDAAARATFTAADYTEAMRRGDFSGWNGVSRPDYAARPDLHADTTGLRLFAPADLLIYSGQPDYLNYFRTADGLAVSNVVSYNESVYKITNPKFECTMVLPGGGAFSMAHELLAYYHGDARFLTYTVYTYGRGFADAHRRFAQAYLALPAVPGAVVEGTPADVRARVYPTANGTYIGVAHKGLTAANLTVDVPGTWTAGTQVTDLVTGQTASATVVGGKLRLTIASGPMQLYAFLADGQTSPTFGLDLTRHQQVQAGHAATFNIDTTVFTGTPGPLQLTTVGAPSGATVTFSANPVTAGTVATMTVAVAASTPAGTSSLSVTATAGGLTATGYATLSVAGDLVISDLKVADTAHSADWQIQPVLRNYLAPYSDRNYTFTSIPASLAGKPWIRAALDSKTATDNPLVTFTINRQATVSVGIDTRLGPLAWLDSSWTKLNGETFTFYDAEDLQVTLAVYQKTFPAGTVALGPTAGGTYSGTYPIVVG